MQHTERARIVAVSCFFLCPPGNPLQAATCLYSSVCVCPLTGRGVRDSTGEKWSSRPHLNWCKYLSVSLSCSSSISSRCVSSSVEHLAGSDSTLRLICLL